MIKNGKLGSGFLFFVLFMLFGCASVPESDEMKAQVATYQLPKLAEDGKAIVYVVCPPAWYGRIRFDVFIGDQEPTSKVGYNMGGQHIYFSLTPGEHKILSKAENWAEINVSAKAGDIIFIHQEPYTGLLNARNRLSILQDYEGKFHVRNSTMGTILNQDLAGVAAAPKQAPQEPALGGDIFIGRITGGNMAKGVGFSNLNVRLFVASERGEQVVFFVRSDSKVFDVDGKPLNYLEASRAKGKKVLIQHFIITDATGGEPGRTDFAFEIGQKGVASMRFLN